MRVLTAVLVDAIQDIVRSHAKLACCRPLTLRESSALSNIRNAIQCSDERPLDFSTRNDAACKTDWQDESILTHLASRFTRSSRIAKKINSRSATNFHRPSG